MLEGGMKLQRIMVILFALALLFMSSGVALEANIAQYGALNTRGAGIDPGAEALAMWLSALATLGALLLLIGAIFSLVRVSQRRQWRWLIVLLVLLPASLYAFLQAGFEADVLAALASLLAPLVYLGYSVKAWSEPRRG